MDTTIKTVRDGERHIEATFVDGDIYAMVHCSELSIAIVAVTAGQVELIKFVSHGKLAIARMAVSYLNRFLIEEEAVAAFVA